MQSLSFQPDRSTDSTQPHTVGSESDLEEKETSSLPVPSVIEGTVTSVHTPRLQGVGGWLALFCVALTILGPLVSLFHMGNSWEEAKPAFDLFPTYKSAVWLEYALSSVILVFGFITGVMIWSGNENGKVLAERYLKIRLVAFVLGDMLILDMLSNLPGEVYALLESEMFVDIYREALVFVIWYAYFKNSKRVAATYGLQAT